jgi:uncharacterized protein (DUF2141 family)
MKNVRATVTTFIALLTIAAVGLGFFAQSASAATYSVTVHARLCPQGQPTTDIFTDCHGYGQSDQTFRVDSGAAQTVAANGNVTFTGLAAGSHVVRRVAGQGPNEFLHERVFCLWKDGTQAEIIPSANGNFVVSLAGGSVTCDVYLIPESAQ